MIELEEIISKYKDCEGALIPALQETQQRLGYLPKEVLTALAEGLDVPLSKVYGVVTFYTQFYLEPHGRNTVRVCQGTACHVRGAEALLAAAKEALGIGEHETTDDLKFTLETVPCLGTCFLSPVMTVNDDYYGKLTPEKVEEILKGYS